MNPFGYVSAIVGLIVVALIFLSVRKVRQRKFLQTFFYGFQSLLFLFLFVSLLLVFSNLNTYRRLTFERDVAEIQIKKQARQQYQVLLGYLGPDEKYRGQDSFLLSGDEWQLDAKILKWKGWANVLGLDSYYQLSRISGRYRLVEQANSLPQSSYQLGDSETGLSLWDLKRLLQSNMSFLDAYFGQSVFLPMYDKATFRVSISQSGLVARAANEAAKQSLEQW